jgi:hypothetical protein
VAPDVVDDAVKVTDVLAHVSEAGGAILIFGVLPLGVKT